MMADPKHLYREIVDLERQLRELLRSNPLNAQDANVLRSRLIERAKALASASPPFAAGKEIEQVLWKPCFYKRIEDFRRRIRKYATAPSSDRTVREHFARVSSEFQDFLRDSAAFYDHMRACYAAWLQSHRAGSSGSGAAPSSFAPSLSAAQQRDVAAVSAAKCRQSLHRCYIFLGDLARYRELHSQKAKKNFAAAESFYHKALALVPENGNPHNQLAVLATYVEAETVAVYRYCRSLLIAQPFATAEENLALLFERARQRPLAGPSSLALTSASSSRDKSAFLKSFLHRLTRMHGLLFSLATAGGTSMPPSGSAVAYPRDIEGVLFKDLHALLHAGAIGDALLLKIVVINVFCVVRALRSTASVKDDAVRLAVRTITGVMEYVREELSKAGGRSSSSGSEQPNSVRLLGPVSVFCDFLRLNPKVVDVLDTALSRAASPGDCSHSAFLESFAALVNHAKLRELYTPLVNLRNDLQEPLRVQQLMLKENIELRGFAPFAALLETPAAAAALTWDDAGGGGISSVPETDALRIRAWNLYGFGKFLCEEYEGNPLLYLYQGMFSTTPTVGGGSASVSNSSFLHAVAGTKQPNAVPVPTFDPFGVRAGTPVEQRNGSSFVTPPKQVRAAADDDEFDDEVIVFQPSPALDPLPSASSVRPSSSSTTSGGGVLGGDANAPWMATTSPFADLSASGAFSLGAPNSQSTPEPKRHSLSDAFSSSSFGASSSGHSTGITGGNAIGSTLGYPNFHSFGGDFGGFSGQGLLAGWGNSEAAPAMNRLGRPPSIPKPSTAFSMSGGSSGNTFAPMMDLAAVERESALYQQEASSLSAFFSSTPRSSSMSSLNESLSARTSPRPPPGFGGGSIARSSETPAPASSSQLYTRNPFINP